jgi:hypothetical protein
MTARSAECQPQTGFLALGRSPASREAVHPLLQVLGAISHQRANFDESRAALNETPSSKGRETHPDLFGHFLFGQKIFHTDNSPESFFLTD